MANQRIDIDVGLKVDKTGLNQIKSSLQEIKNLTAQDLMRIGGHTDIQKAEQELKSLKASISQIDGALEKAFNTDLGTLNVSKFNQALKGMNLNQVYKDFSAAGAAGQAAFRNVTSQILTTNMQLKQTHNFLNNMATTMANTVKWGVASSIMNNFTGSVQKAYGYVKSLDTSLNDIRIVTGASADEMERFAVKANNAAKELGKSTTDYTEAALIYYQQGLSDEEVEARAETTLKAANVTGQSGQAVSEQLTAVWNGYKVSAEEAELYIDKLAAVAATTASDLEELSTGMSKVASAANLMGVDADQLSAQLSTIISVTRQAPESVGTALKTIYARMGDIESGLDADTTLGHYTEEMKAMGVNVLDANGKLRDMGSVIEEIGGKWQSMTREQQIALSQTMAGTRQYNNLLSLFDNWDMYTKALDTSAQSAGTLQKQQDTYMESTQAHLNQLRAASEDLYDSLLDPKGLNPVIDGLTLMTNLFSNFVDSIGGGGNILLALGSIGTKVFSQQLASGIATFITNLQNAKDNAAQLRAELEITQKYQGSNINDSQIKTLVDMKRQVLDLDKSITNEERNIANEYINQQNELYKQQDALKQKAQEAQKLYENLTGTSISVDPKTGKGASKLGAELLKEAGDFEQYTNKANITRKAILELTAARRQFEEARGKTIGWDAEAKDFQPYQQAIDKTKQKIQEYINTVDSLKNKGKLSPQGIEDVNSSYEKLEKVVGNVNQIQLSNGKHVAALKTYYEETSAVIQKTGSAIISLGGDMQALEGQLSNNKKYIDELQQSYTNFLNGVELRAKIQQNLQLVSSFGQLASAMTSIGNMDSIWSNESLSAGEKMLQTVTNLGFALPMLANSLGKILPLETAIGAARQKQIATLVARNGIEASYNLAVKTGLPPQLALIAAQEKKNGNTAFYNRLLRIQRKLIEGKNLTESQQIFLDEALAASKRKVGLSAIFASGGLKAFWGALGFMGQLTVVIVALAAAAKAFDHFHTSAKEAGENLDTSIERFQETKNELESLESELQTTKERMEELLSLDTLTLTEKEELTELEKQNAQLEVQIELLKQKQKLESQQVARDARIAAEKGTYNKDTTDKPFSNQGEKAADSGRKEKGSVDRYTSFSTGVSLNTADFEVQKNEIDVNDQSTFDSWKKGMQGLYEQAIKNADEASDITKKAWTRIAEKLEKDIEETEDKYRETQAQNTEALEEGYLKGQEVLPDLRENNVNGINDKAIAHYENIIRRYYESLGTFDSLVTGTMDKYLSVDNQAKLASAGEINSEEDLSELIGEDAFNQMKEYSEMLGVSIFDIVERFQTMYGDLSELDIEALKEKLRAEKVEDITTSFNEGLGEGETQLQASDLEGLSNEQLSNWEALVPYIEEAYKQTGNYKDAIAEAVKEQEKDLDIQNAKKVANEGAEKYDLDANEIQEYAEHLQDIAKESDKVSDALENQAEVAAEIAVANKRLNKGLNDLSDNWEDWNKILKTGDKESAEYAKALGGVEDALANILDIDDFGVLSDDFVANNLEDIKDAANGSLEAVQNLREAAAQDIAVNLDLPEDQKTALSNEINNFIANTDFEDLEVGAELDDTNFINALNELIWASEEGAGQAQEILNSLGYTPEISYEPVTITNQDEKTGMSTVEYADPTTGKTVTTTVQSSLLVDDAGTMMIPIINGSKVNYKGSPGVSAGGKKRTSGGKKGGGGGGGGGGGAKKQKEDHVKTEKDRYHDVNVRLKQIDKELEDIGKDQEKYFGKDLIKALNKELDILEKQKKVYKEKLDIAKQEQKELQNSLKSDGVKFNSDGTISNYEKALQAQEDALNKLIDKYNKLPASKQEKFKETVLDPAKEEFEKFKKNIERYDELLLDEIPEIEDSLQEIADREIEINVQKLKMEVEIRLDLSEAEKDWNEFQREVIDGIDSDDILGNAQSDKNLYETLLGNGTLEGETNKIKNIMKAINDINTKGSSEIYGDNKQLAMDDLKEAMDEIMGSMTDLNDLKKNIDEAYLDMIDEMGDAFDNQTESLEYVNELLEHNVNLTELLHGEDAYAEMAKHYEDIVANNLKIIAANQEAAAFYKNKMQTETDPEAAEKWKELWKDAVAELNDSVENSIQTITDQYMNSIDLAFDKMKEKLASLVGDGKNKKDFGYYSLEWELANEEAEKYLGTMDKAYELQKLGNKYQKSINDTSSVKAQRELNKLMDEEMKKLREKDKLTQYDIDRANARYELKLKEIALEEAQQNKSQMRLRRDSSGNYSYQFVADEEAIANAEQEVADATHSLFEMDQDEMNQKGQEYLDTMQEWNERLKEVDIEDKEARELINKEYQERLKLIQEDYLSIEQNLYESAFMDRALLYDENIATYQAMSDKEREILMNEMVPTWDTGVRQMMDAMVGPEGLGPACEQAMEDLKDATDTYNESLAAIESTAKTTFDTTKTEYTENITLANDLVKEAKDLVTETQNELTAVNDLKQGVDTLATSYETVYKNATDALTAAQNLWKAEQEHAAEEAKKNNPDSDGDGGKTSTTEGKKDDNEGKTSTSESGKGDKTLKKGDRVTYESGKYYYTSAGDSPTGTKERGKKVYITKVKKGAKYPIHISTGSSLGDGDLGWLKEKQLKFDTGGYTGDWAGNDGKTAILHKKELVLNAKDTENVLATVNIVRDMQSMIDSLNNSILSRTNGFMDSINANLGFDTNFGTDLNQQVSIQASFPNVSSRMEIEQAFENLVNLASQHAFDTRR